MKLFALVLAMAIFPLGCRKLSGSAQFGASSADTEQDSRLQNMGVVRIRSTYSLASGDFLTTCTGTLLHTGDKAVPDCVALTAAHCFKNLPKTADHRIELLDGTGKVDKEFSAQKIWIHPNFTAESAQLSTEHSAFDQALVQFSCTLPAYIRSARIGDFKQVPVNGTVLVASLPNHPSQDSLSAKKTDFLDASLAVPQQIHQAKLKIASLDFPPQSQVDSSTTAVGVLSLQKSGQPGACDFENGNPVFYDDGRELLLIATGSAGGASCDHSLGRFTLTAPLVAWMEESVGKGVVSFSNRSVTQPTLANALNAEVLTTPTALPGQTPQQGQIPRSIATATPVATPAAQTDKPVVEKPSSLPTATATPNRRQVSQFQRTTEIDISTPAPLRVATEESAGEVKKASSSHSTKAKLRSSPTQAKAQPNNKSSAAPQSKEQPRKNTLSTIPSKPALLARSVVPGKETEIETTPIELIPTVVPPIPEVEETPMEPVAVPTPLARTCSGRTWLVNSKSRVWGTVVKLVDKEEAQIGDESLKCDLPNDTEVCLKEQPEPSDNGDAKAELADRLTAEGCEKFKSGRTFYFRRSDFTPK